MAFCAVSILEVRAAPQARPDDYLIEYATSAMEQHTCRDCPGFVAQMLGVLPETFAQVTDRSQVVVEDCQATLIAPDLVITASHCMRTWDGPLHWSQLAGGDCSRAYAFYFPATDRYPYEEVRCRAILTPILSTSGRLQLAPDDVLVRLDHPVKRDPAPIGAGPISEGEKVDIWGYISDIGSYAHRACHLVEGSVLTPLDRSGASAYVTLTCDGSITPGCSGAGVFVAGQWRGLISCGVADTSFGAAQFGNNEVVISQGACRISGNTLPPAWCFVTTEQRQHALYDLYLSAIDRSGSWIADTLKLLQTKFPYANFAYVHGPRTTPEFSYTPGFTVKCVFAALLPKHGKILVDALFDLTTFLPRYVLLNPDTTVLGVSRRSESGEGVDDEVNIGWRFRWLDVAQAGTRSGVPYCP